MSHDSKPNYETTTPSGALFAFYASCTGVGLGATVAACALIVFGGSPASTVTAIVAIVITIICSFLTWWTLARARGDR